MTGTEGTALTDPQFAALLTVIGGGLAAIGAAIKFGIARVVKSNDAGTAALIANTSSNAVLSEKVAALGKQIDGISDWMEAATPVGAMPPTPRNPHRGNTPAGGVPAGAGFYSIAKTRGRTRGDE